MLAACTLAAMLAVWRPAPLPALDQRVYDALARADAAPETDPVQSAIVVIDEASLAAVGPWPWSADDMTALVDRLRELGATAIGFDVFPGPPDSVARVTVPALASAMDRGRAVASYALDFDEPPLPSACTLPPLELVERQRGDTPPSAGLLQAAGAVCPSTLLAAAAGALGFVGAIPDSDGRLRRVPLVVRVGEGVYPSLALAVVRQASGGGAVVLDARSDGSMTLTVGARTVALDARGRLLVRAARQLPARAPISAADVIERRLDDEQIRGRAVFVSAAASPPDQLVATPLDAALPAIVVQAAVADTLLGGPAYERGEFAFLAEATSAVAAVLITSFVIARADLLAAAASGVVLSAAAWWWCAAMLTGTGQYLSPLWVIVGAAAMITTEGVTTLVRERRHAGRTHRQQSDAERLLAQALAPLAHTRGGAADAHARRIQACTRLLATALAGRPALRPHLPPGRIALIATLAPLHDIDIAGVPHRLLHKPAALTPEEHAEMRRPPVPGPDRVLSEEALAGIDDDEVIAVARDIAHTHHERWDGAGHPRGLRGAEIPLAGRIVAVVDVYDALVTDGAALGGMSHDAAVGALGSGRGQHFDPDVLDAFLTVHEAIREIHRG